MGKRSPRRRAPAGEDGASGFRRFLETIADVRRHPATMVFLCAYLLYNDGIQTVNDVHAICDALENVHWEGRFEILNRNPFIVVDGAHNGDSARMLVRTLQDLFPDARLHFIFGASSDKDIAGIFAEILGEQFRT